MGVLALKSSPSVRLRNLIAAHPAVVFTRPDCPSNSNITEIFRKLEVDFTSIDLTSESFDLTYELIEMTKRKDVPAVFVDNEYLGGYEELQKSVKTRTLMDKLRQANVPWKDS
jgi:glutaredoxin